MQFIVLVQQNEASRLCGKIYREANENKLLFERKDQADIDLYNSGFEKRQS